MRISDEELELFRDWQPGDSITMDVNSDHHLLTLEGEN